MDPTSHPLMLDALLNGRDRIAARMAVLVSHLTVAIAARKRAGKQLQWRGYNKLEAIDKYIIEPKVL